MAGDDCLLEMDAAGVVFGEAEVLRDISLTVRRGDFISIIGPNGAGKSTLLKAMVGLVPLTRGRVISRARAIGYVPQQLPLDRRLPLTVSEFLSLRAGKSRFWFGAGGPEVRKRIHAKLEEIGAWHLVDRQLGKLSGGEFQRILIAYALMNDPDLLLLDEPLTGVDMRGGLSFDGLLHHLHEHRGIPIVMVSHDLHLVEHLSDMVFCINRDVCCQGPPDEVLQPEALERAYGHLPGMVRDSGGGAFIPLREIR